MQRWNYTLRRNIYDDCNKIGFFYASKKNFLKSNQKLTKLFVALGIFSATNHTKTGLIRYYGRWPLLLIALYLCTFSTALFGFSFLDAFSRKKLVEKSEYIGLLFLKIFKFNLNKIAKAINYYWLLFHTIIFIFVEKI